MNSYYVTPKLQGGLGNFLFQIATAFSISKRDNKNFVVNTDDINVIHNPIDFYIENIFRKIPFVKKFVDYKSHNPYQPIVFDEIPNTKSNIKLNGYYQNEKYFLNIRKEILDLFEIDEATIKYINQKYPTVGKNTCSIHVRRGNYLKSNGFHPVQDTNYFNKAISNFDKNTTFFIFSDDINWCKENLNHLKNKIFVQDNLDYQDLYLMSFCENHIISNSSFSWWGAWMNINENKKVYYPLNWFGDKRLDSKEIKCNDWVGL